MKNAPIEKWIGAFSVAFGKFRRSAGLPFYFITMLPFCQLFFVNLNKNL